jgi:hypothetical protein
MLRRAKYKKGIKLQLECSDAKASQSGFHLRTSNLTHALIITHRHIFYSCGGYRQFPHLPFG